MSHIQAQANMGVVCALLGRFRSVAEQDRSIQDTCGATVFCPQGVTKGGSENTLGCFWFEKDFRGLVHSLLLQRIK